MGALEHMRRREREDGVRNALLLLGGCAVVAASGLAFIGLVLLLARRLATDSTPRLDLLSGIAGGMAAIAYLIAMFTHRDSRSAVIEEFLDQGTHSTGGGGGDNPLVRWAMVLAMIGMLHGAFMSLDALANARLRHRLRGADRHRAATILGTLRRQHAGIDPRLLLRHGEDPLELRRTIAYLMTFRWADISPAGDHLVALSPARQRLRIG